MSFWTGHGRSDESFCHFHFIIKITTQAQMKFRLVFFFFVVVPYIFSSFNCHAKHRTLDMDLKFEEHSHLKTKTMSGIVNHVQTFRSPPMPLHFGEVVFTNPSRTPLEMPTGNNGVYTITSFTAGVVDEAGNQVPLDEVYNHHWLVFDGKGNLGPCRGLDYKFGVGAESRGFPVEFPAPYGLVTDGTETWEANIHLLRTVNLDPSWGVQKCIECHGPNKWCNASQSGTFTCCDQGTYCPTVVNSSVTAPNPKTYYLQYTVGWHEVTPEDKPVGIFVLDASGESLFESNVSNISLHSVFSTHSFLSPSFSPPSPSPPPLPPPSPSKTSLYRVSN